MNFVLTAKVTFGPLTDMSSSKVYTRTGDQGTTSLFGGARVMKSHPRLEAYGTLDELNSVTGLLIADIENENWANSAAPEAARLVGELHTVQESLFVLGSHLATEDEAVRTKLPGLKPDAVKELEAAMDRMSTDLAPLKHFILPGGTRPASSAHLARTVARRAEREIVALMNADESAHASTSVLEIVKHVNRLNDYFFVLARHLNRLANREERVWKP